MLPERTCPTFFLALQWQQTVHRYLKVLHRRMMKRPPKKVTMDEARKAHHIRWPLLSQGTSGENGIIMLILDMWTDGSGVNFSLFFGIIGAGLTCQPRTANSKQKTRDSGALGSSGQRPLMPQRLSHVESTTSAFSSGFSRRGHKKVDDNHTHTNKKKLGSECISRESHDARS